MVSPYFLGVSHDKLIADSVLKGIGLPRAETFAIYHRTMRVGDTPVCRTPQELAGFLREEMTYPCFSKPVIGRESRGVAQIESYNAENDTLVLNDKGEVGVDAFAAEIDKLVSGALFQELLRPHAEIADLQRTRLHLAHHYAGGVRRARSSSARSGRSRPPAISRTIFGATGTCWPISMSRPAPSTA